MCSSKFLLILNDTKNHYHDSVLLSQISISGYTDTCYEDHETMLIYVYENYGICIKILCNSQFHGLNQMALRIQMGDTDASLLIMNCTFSSIKCYKSNN